MSQTIPTDAPSPSRGEHAAAMAAYAREGEARAEAIGNRGPLRLDDHGRLDPDIVDAYHQHGYYVFQGVVGPDEVGALRAAVDATLDRAPTGPGAELDAHGRPAVGRDLAVDPFLFAKPLSDPWGGTKLLAGRHPTQMTQPTPDPDAPDHVVHLMLSMCTLMPEALCLYGHPGLLAVAASINGDDFAPYNDAIFVKKAGLGASVSWHQDGATHWDHPNWDEDIHGFNFQVQLYPTTAANALWVIPGSHKQGKADIEQMVADNGGRDLLPGALPMICDAGDVTMANRQIVHGSFANSSPDPRVSITYGFHRRSSVLGVAGMLKFKPGAAPPVVFDEERIARRAAVIGVAIDARRQRFPDEHPFAYAPLAGQEDDHRYGPDTIDTVLRDYNLHDLAI